MLKYGQLKKMLAELEAAGKITDDTTVVANADEFDYWYSPDTKTADDLLEDMSDSIAEIESMISYYEKKAKNAPNPEYAAICQNNIKARRDRIKEYEALGRICLKIS